MHEIRKMCIWMVMQMYCNKRRICPKSYSVDFYANRAKLRALVYSSESTCFNQLRMSRATFVRLCGMLETIGGLKPTKNMLVDEQVAIFVNILAHHVKNRAIQFQFGRSGESISRHFHTVLNAMMHLEETLLKTPEPVPDDSTDERWKWFKVRLLLIVFIFCNCLFIYLLQMDSRLIVDG